MSTVKVSVKTTSKTASGSAADTARRLSFDDATERAPEVSPLPRVPLPMTREGAGTGAEVPEMWGDVVSSDDTRVRDEVERFFQRFAPVLRRTTDSALIFALHQATSPLRDAIGCADTLVDHLRVLGHVIVEMPDATRIIRWRDERRTGPAGGEPDDDTHSEVSDERLMPEKRPADLPDGLESGSVVLATAFWAKWGTSGLLPLFRKRGELSRFYIDSFAAGTWGEGLSPRHFSQVLFALSRSLKVVRVESDRRTGRTGVHLHWTPSSDEVARARDVLRQAGGTMRGRPARPHSPPSHRYGPREVPPRGVSGGTFPVGGGRGGGGAPRVDDEVSRVLSSRGYTPRDHRAAGGGGRDGGRREDDHEARVRAEVERRVRQEMAMARLEADPTLWENNRSSSPVFHHVPRRAYYGARR